METGTAWAEARVVKADVYGNVYTIRIGGGEDIEISAKAVGRGDVRIPEVPTGNLLGVECLARVAPEPDGSALFMGAKELARVKAEDVRIVEDGLEAEIFLDGPQIVFNPVVTHRTLAETLENMHPGLEISRDLSLLSDIGDLMECGHQHDDIWDGIERAIGEAYDETVAERPKG